MEGFIFQFKTVTRDLNTFKMKEFTLITNKC